MHDSSGNFFPCYIISIIRAVFLWVAKEVVSKIADSWILVVFPVEFIFLACRIKLQTDAILWNENFPTYIKIQSSVVKSIE